MPEEEKDPRKPRKLADAVHIDDYMPNRRKDLQRLALLEGRVGALEVKNDEQETTMKEMNESIATIEKVIIGDIHHPEKPGMAPVLSVLASDVKKLVAAHEDEEKMARTQLAKQKWAIEKLPWKTITAAIAVMGTLAAIIHVLVKALLKQD